MTTYHLTSAHWSATLRPEGDWRPLRDVLEQLGVTIVPMLRHDSIEIVHGSDVYLVTYEANKVLHTIKWTDGQPPESVSLADLPEEVRETLFDLLNGGL